MSDNIPTGGVKSLVAILKSDQIISQLNEYCSTAPGINAEIRKSAAPLANASELVNGGGDIVIIEAGLIDEDGFKSLEQLCSYVMQGGSFIVIAEEPPMSVVRRLFKAGVTDVLPSPVVESEFSAALDTAVAALPLKEKSVKGAGAKGVVLTVLKSTGGVGATTVAVNLATEIKRRYEVSVALADFDLQFGDMHLALDLQPRMNLLEAIGAGDRLDSTLLRSTMTSHSSGVELLASPPEITPLDAVNDDFVTACLEKFRSSFDITIIEPPSCWTDWTGTLLAQSDLIIPVLEPNVRSGAGAARMMRCFQELELVRPPLFSVVNKVEKSFATNDRLSRLTEIIGRKSDVVIGDDRSSANEAFDCGVPIRGISAKSIAVKGYAMMAEKVSARLGLDLALTAPAAHKKGFSLKSLRPGGG